ncbi:MAG: glutaredoxin family protein [Proteobacteria bacterium]|nr:glutaredoxin family protein [Pseudomonadota bacterium]
MIMKHIDGDDKVRLSLYTLSTCIWCKMTKKLLSDLGVGYDYVDMDSLEGGEKEKTLEDLKRWNPKCSFPSLVINNENCIVGYDDKRIKEAIGR